MYFSPPHKKQKLEFCGEPEIMEPIQDNSNMIIKGDPESRALPFLDRFASFGLSKKFF